VKAKKLIPLALLFYSLASNAREWDKIDYSLLGIAGTGIILDWGQTRYIVKHPQTFHELNPSLGNYPSMGNVNKFFIGRLVLHGTAAYLLPDPFRKIWLGGEIMIRFNAVKNNRSIGVGFNF